MTDPIEIAARALCTESNHAIFDATEHRGDCTGECFTCPLCEANNYREIARQALTNEGRKMIAVVEAARKLLPIAENMPPCRDGLKQGSFDSAVGQLRGRLDDLDGK